jgi:hypothetical protein
MADITTTTAAVFLPTIWSTEVLLAAENALVASNLVRRFDSQVKGRGQTLEIPTIANITATAKSANTDVVPTSNTEAAIILNINSWFYAAVKIEDLAEVQSNYDLRSLYAEKIGYAVAKQVDSDVLSNYTGLTTTDVGAYGTDVDDGTLLAADLTLNLNDVPREDRVFIVHPYQIRALLSIDKFVRAFDTGQVNSPSRIITGPNSRYLFGELYGTPVYYTNNIPTTAGTPTQYHNVLIHKEAWALAMQQTPRLQAQYLVASLAWLVVVDSIYGTTTIRATFGCEVRS